MSEVTARGSQFGFSITNLGCHVGLPGTIGACIVAVTNNGAYMVMANSNLNDIGWLPVFTNAAPFTYAQTDFTTLYQQYFYRVAMPI